MNFKTLLLSPHGRIKRRPYWIGTIILIALEIPVLLVPSRVMEEAIYLLFYYPSICLCAKRLHDLGRSGWWQLISWIAAAPLMISGWALALTELTSGPAAAQLMEGRQDASTVYLGLLVAGLVIILAFTLYIGLVGGQEHPNRYGPAPDAPAIEDVF